MSDNNIPDFIKEKARTCMAENISPNDFMKNFNKQEVMKKLNEIGMSDAAKKLSALNENDIARLINSNPQILKKAAEIINNRR